jgi:hypothetical protein
LNSFGSRKRISTSVAPYCTLLTFLALPVVASPGLLVG